MPQVQVRVPEEILRELDRWVKEGRFRSRSDAIKTVLSLYGERDQTRSFYKMLTARSREARKKPSILIPLGDIE